MSRKRLIDLILMQALKRKVFTISLIGSMGEGKTSFMRYLAKHAASHGYRCFYVNSPAPEEIPDILRELRGSGEKIAIFLDDISFIVSGTAREVKAAENALTRIRHILENSEGHTLLTLAYHYNRAVNPFLRHISRTVVLFDISRVEIEDYSNIFTKRMLWEYYRLYTAYTWEHPKLIRLLKRRGKDPSQWKPVLARVMDKELIAWIPYVPPEDAPWEDLTTTTRDEAGNGKPETPPPVTFREFAKKLRELGIRARTEKLLKAYHWIFEELLGYKIEPAIKPAEEEEEEAPGKRAQEALAPA